MKKGWESYGQYGKFAEAANEFRKGITIDSSNADLWYNLGGAYYSNRQYAEAVEAWRMALRIKPDHQKAQMGLQAAMMALNGGAPPPPKKK